MGMFNENFKERNLNETIELSHQNLVSPQSPDSREDIKPETQTHQKGIFVKVKSKKNSDILENNCLRVDHP
jgi:hypothetical protein